MKISRVSELTGRTRTQELPITEEQYIDYMLGDGLIQHVLPELSADQREFLINGSTPEERSKLFNKTKTDEKEST